MKKENLHKNNGGFKVPKDYFESFEDKLSKKIAMDTNKNKLSNNKVPSGFTVPENYFEDSKNNILQKISVDQPKDKVISLITKRNIIYFSGIAAMIAIIFSLSINTKSELNFNDLEIADIHVYFSEGNIELSSSEIASLLDDEIDYVDAFEEDLDDNEALLEYISQEDLDDEIIFTE